jgi:hypothetical protein
MDLMWNLPAPPSTKLKREVLAWELFPTTKGKISEVVASCHKK